MDDAFPWLVLRIMMNIKKFLDFLWVVLLSVLIVISLELLTNSIDTQANAWDYKYYIAMARDGFSAQPMASPFAYRYLTTLIVHWVLFSGISIENGFRSIAYIGAIAQLTGIFYFVTWLTRSRKGAYLGIGVTALSLFNVKFLLFDVYRPDHLAYGLILLQTYFAFKRKFLPLLIVTIIASQIREFNIIPLVAYLFMRWHDKDRAVFIREMTASVVFLSPVIILPRLLIPVTEDYQIVGLSKNGIVTMLFLPLVPSVDANFLFVVAAYFLPLLFLAGPKTIKMVYINLPDDQQRYLSAYTILVLLLTFLGGTDFFRFTTFLFLPQIIFICLLAAGISNLQIMAMIISTFIFNRIWMHIPDWDVEKYRDFYGGFSLRLNIHTLYRTLELSIFLVVGMFLRNSRLRPTSD